MRLLDIFVGALIVFPWLTESIRFDTPGGGTIELADWAVPLLVVGVVAEAPRLWWRASGSLSMPISSPTRRTRSRQGTHSGASRDSAPGSRTLSLTVTTLAREALATVTAQCQPM